MPIIVILGFTALAILILGTRGGVRTTVTPGVGTKQIEASLRKALPSRLARWARELALAFEETSVDPFLLAAIMDRESNGGGTLKPPGPTGTGDLGHGRGLMQIDDRAHKVWVATHDWQDPLTNIIKGAEEIKSKRASLARLLGRGPSLNEIIAAYNTGEGNVKKSVTASSPRHPDATTNGGNYSVDVLRRYARFPGGGSVTLGLSLYTSRTS